MKKIGAVVSDELAAGIRLTAERWNVSSSEVIRKALEVFTGSEQDQFFMFAEDEPEVCAECREGIHLEYAGADMGVLAGASVWEHDRWRSTMADPHDPRPSASPDLGTTEGVTNG